MNYRLLDGKTISQRALEVLSWKDVMFLLDLKVRAEDGEDYFDLAREVCGTGAYPLNGSLRVTRKVHDTALFQVAMDIVDRAGIQQGRIAPD